MLIIIIGQNTYSQRLIKNVDGTVLTPRNYHKYTLVGLQKWVMCEIRLGKRWLEKKRIDFFMIVS